MTVEGACPAVAVETEYYPIGLLGRERDADGCRVEVGWARVLIPPLMQGTVSTACY